MSMSDTSIGSLNGVIHYQDGHYTYAPGGDTKNLYGGRLEGWFDIISNDYNRLKGKLFNLVDATIQDVDQRKAVKGLIMGFCNDAFMSSDRKLYDFLREMGFYDGGDNAGAAVACGTRAGLTDEQS